MFRLDLPTRARVFTWRGPRINGRLRQTAPLFPTLRRGKLADRTPLPQANVYMMIQRRATAAGIETKISAHSFRAPGITTYLQNGGKLEVVQQIAGHESARTTGLYDRRNDAVELDEVERVVLLKARHRQNSGGRLFYRLWGHVDD